MRTIRSILALTCVFFGTVSTVEARVFASPPPLEPGQETYVQNPDGTFTDYLGGKKGEPAIRGNTYTEAEIQESDAIFAETAVETGGGTPSTVVPDGADYGYSAATTEDAAGQIRMDLQTGKPYATPGEAAIGDGVINEGISSGWLPSISSALRVSGGVLSGVGALYWGVKLGDIADKYLLHIPTLEETLFGVTKREPKTITEVLAECGGFCVTPKTLERTAYFFPGTELTGEVYRCDEPPYLKEFLPTSEETCFGVNVEGLELVSYLDSYTKEEKREEYTLRMYGAGFHFALASIVGEVECPPQEKLGPFCTEESLEGETLKEEVHGVMWEPLSEALFGGYPDESFAGETAAKGTSGVVETPPRPKEITPPAPAEVPSQDTHHIVEKAHKKPNKEGEKPVPLLPPLEKGAEIPNPENPVVPEPTKGGELFPEYASDVERAGFTVAPESYTLPESAIDPSVGPDDVSPSRISPSPGTSAGPTTKLRVGVNPSDAPVPNEGHVPIGGPTLPGFDLPDFGVLCKGFPFGVPCWLAATIEAWSTTKAAPKWGIESFTVEGHTIPGATVDLAKLEPIMEVVRPAMVVFATIGLVLLFYRFAKGGSPPSGGGGDSGGGGQSYAEEQGDFIRGG